MTRIAGAGGQATGLLAAARDAFSSGVHTVGVVSAVSYAGLAVLALRAFSQVRNAQGATEPVPETAASEA